MQIRQGEKGQTRLGRSLAQRTDGYGEEMKDMMVNVEDCFSNI